MDWAETHPEEFIDNNLHGSWNVLRAAERAGVETVVVASTDKAATAASFYGRTKRFMEQLTAYVARRAGARRVAVRFVNVLGSAGSASDLFLRQARAGVPLSVTDTGMVRYWITLGHAATLAVVATPSRDQKRQPFAAWPPITWLAAADGLLNSFPPTLKTRLPSPSLATSQT